MPASRQTHEPPTSSSRPRRRPGRPRGGSAPETRDLILKTARSVLAERGFPGTTIREIANRAGVNPAMVHYYFGSKRGLHTALIERIAAELRGRVEALASVEGSPKERLRSLVRMWVELIGHDPYLPRMIVQEILIPEGEELDSLAANFVGPIAGRILGVLSEGVDAGELRPIEPPLIVPSIAGLVVFVFLAAPMLRRVFGLDVASPEFVQLWAEHASDLLVRGLAADGAPT